MNGQNKGQQGSQNVNNIPIYNVGITIGLTFFFTLMIVLWPYFGYNKSPTLLNELSDAGVARGLITFLVVVVVVGIALFLSISAVLVISNKNRGDNVDWDEHFTKAKDVLGLLIGVLGTIVGFYFGQANSEETSPKYNNKCSSGTCICQS
jgi:amino acid transporter